MLTQSRLRPLAPLLLLALTVTGCATGASSAGPSPAAAVDSGTGSAAYRGIALGDPASKPDAALTDTSGQPYDIATKTKGKAVLLFFGYTRCPDVCPTTLADIAGGLRRVDDSVRSDLTVLFVTTDPAYDTPERIRAYLDRFNPSFVGLTGNPDALEQAQKQAGVPVATIDSPTQDAAVVDIAHSASVIAYSPDDRAHVAYTAQTPIADYAHDIPLLVAGEHPAIPSPEAVEGAPATGQAGDVTVFGVTAYDYGSTISIRMSIASASEDPQRLTGALSLAGPVELLDARGNPLDGLDLSPSGIVEVGVAGGPVLQVTTDDPVGTTIPLQLDFTTGSVQLKVPVQAG